MKKLALEPHMLAVVGGTFYPQGYTLVMWTDLQHAQAAAQKLWALGFVEDEVYVVSPHDVMTQIAPTIKDADQPLPSVGSEAGAVRQYMQLAQQGHVGLLIPTPDHASLDRLKQLLSSMPYAVARRYSRWVIEEL